MKLTTILLPALYCNIAAARATSSWFSSNDDSQLRLQDDDPLKVPGKNPLLFCADPTDNILEIQKADLDPNPPKAGTTLSISAEGYLNEDIEEGAKVHITVKYGVITLINQETDLCEQTKNVDLECPLEKGELKLTKDVDLPKEIPPGNYHVLADVYTKDGKKITCLTAAFRFFDQVGDNHLSEAWGSGPANKVIRVDVMMDNDEYSDLTITSHGQSFNVHKVIVCNQSAFFRNACKKNAFKEGETGVIDLPDDDLVAVKAMVEFMYTSEYVCTKDSPQYLLHAKVACLAHKYNLETLKETAHDHFKRAIIDPHSGGSDEAGLAEAIKHIYENSGNNDETRLVIVETVRKHVPAFLGNEEGQFSVMMAGLGEFGRDVAKSTRSTTQTEETYRFCASCKMTWKIDSVNSLDFVCPICEVATTALANRVNYKWQCKECGNTLRSTPRFATFYTNQRCNYCQKGALHPLGPPS
ncbi:hypothetical protein FKW77_009751 [Venturia effusa]|uniref:Phosphatidylglycerol/phosphatidylinositol transfer protein n=1 Tax=Venturia effusa TaxID=50376 RepID=A0A517L240_9PEZI|nr:hypothetical protein FKW77_009751 [Venturia effusa]